MNYVPRIKRIKAFQVKKHNRVNTEKWPEWLQEAYNKPRQTENSVYALINGSKNGRLALGKDRAMVEWNWWIIMDENGNIRTMSPGWFRDWYEPEEDMDPGMFDGFDKLFRFILLICVVFVPLGIWQLCNIAWWMWNHISVAW